MKSTPGTIGYVELAYATQNGMSVARIKNKAGKFVAPHAWRAPPPRPRRPRRCPTISASPS
jgi:hypothetical protein